MNNGLKKSEIEIIRHTLSQVESVQQAILFGSRAKGSFKPGSDIDIAVKGCKPEEIIKLSMLLNEETTLPFFFDILAFERITNKELLQHIKRVGQIIYAKH